MSKIIIMKLVADLHVHTIASGHAYSTVEEVVRSAREKGLLMVGIAEHGPRLPGGPHMYYFGNLRVIPRELWGVRVLKGVEANIISPEGELDLPERFLAQLDFVFAGFHVNTGFDGGTVEENTRAMIGAMRNPYVDGIVHPGNPAYSVDIEAVVKAAKEMGKLLEINNSSLTLTRTDSLPNCQEFARRIAQLDAEAIIGSDAHFSTLVGTFDAAVALAEAAGLTERHVINTSAERVLRFLEARRTSGIYA